MRPNVMHRTPRGLLAALLLIDCPPLIRGIGVVALLVALPALVLALRYLTRRERRLD